MVFLLFGSRGKVAHQACPERMRTAAVGLLAWRVGWAPARAQPCTRCWRGVRLATAERTTTPGLVWGRCCLTLHLAGRPPHSLFVFFSRSLWSLIKRGLLAAHPEDVEKNKHMTLAGKTDRRATRLDCLLLQRGTGGPASGKTTARAVSAGISTPLRPGSTATSVARRCTAAASGRCPRIGNTSRCLTGVDKAGNGGGWWGGARGRGGMP